MTRAYEPPTITDCLPTPAQLEALDRAHDGTKVVGVRGRLLFLKTSRGRYRALRPDGTAVPVPAAPRRRITSGYTAAQDRAIRRLFESTEPAEVTICRCLDHLVLRIPDGRAWTVSPDGNTVALASPSQRLAPGGYGPEIAP